MCIKVFSQTYEQLQTLQVQKTSNLRVVGGGGRKKNNKNAGSFTAIYEVILSHSNALESLSVVA